MAAGDGPDSAIFRPAGISYLRIPSTDPKASAAFYEAVFVEVAGEAGIRPYVYVESVEDALEKVTANGGSVVTPPYPEGDLTAAVFRDPAGSVVGVWQRG